MRCARCPKPAGAGRVVVSRRRIAAAVSRLAGQIAKHYGSRPLTILGVMNGAMVFLADLVRRLGVATELELVSASYYAGRVRRAGGPRLGAVPCPLRGRNVLIVDDVLDSGRTLGAIVTAVRRRRPRSVRTCVLLRKKGSPDRLKVDFVGCDIGDEFVVGYGLDFNNLYRNLPDIRALD